MSTAPLPDRWARLLLGLVLWAGTGQLAAHPISITTLNSNLDGRDMEVRVFALVEDLLLFGAARPGPFGRFDRPSLEEAAKEHANFYGRHLHWYADGHRKLEGELIDIDLSDVPEEGVDLDNIKRHSFIFHFRFRDVGQPSTLTLYQDLGGEKPPVMSDLHWGAFQNDVPVDRTAIMHRQAHTAELEWDADWDRLRADPEAAAAHWQERENDPLKIPGTSAVFAFVYFDEQGARVELLVPLLILDRWMNLPFDDEGRLSVEAQQRLRAEVAEVLGATHLMEIDGQDVAPRLQRLQFLGPRAEDLAMDAPEQDVFRMNGRVSLILRYPVREVPQGFRMQWKNFEGVPNIPASIYTYDRPRLGTFFGPQTEAYEWEEPEPRQRPAARPRPAPPQRPALGIPATSAGLVLAALVVLVLGWRRFLPRPLALAVLVLCLAGAWLTRSWTTVGIPLPGRAAPALEEDEVDAVFASLQDNLYRAFRFADEPQIYDALADEVTPDLIEPLYFQVLDSLRMEDQGGAIARVDSVERVSLEAVRQESNPQPLVEVDAEWLVKGTVEHWGHIHSRTHRHRARFELLGQDDAWKIRRFEPLHVERVERSIEVRP
jgi:hypothetical protein